MICQKSGKEIADGASFCPYCGKATGNTKVQNEFNEMVKKEDEKANKICDFLCTVRAIMLMIAGVMGAYKVGGGLGAVIAVFVIAFILVKLAGSDSKKG